MSATASKDGIRLLNGLRYLGITVEADAAQLRINAPAGRLTPALRKALGTHKQALLSAVRADVAPSALRELPLSFEQERVWLGQQLDPDSAEFNLALAFAIDGPLSPTALAQAMTDITRRHEILRTSYMAGPDPAQVIREVDFVPLPVVDLTTLPGEQRQVVSERIANAEIQRRFDLQRDLPLRALLVKLEDQKHWLVICRHHVAADGWSLGLFLRELVFAYEAFRCGRPSGLAAPQIQYAQYAITQRLMTDDAEIERHFDFWSEKLRGADPIVFPRAAAAATASASAGAVSLRQLGPSQAKSITVWCRQNGVTAFSAYLAAFLAVLGYRYGRSDLAIATDYANRDSLERESVIGMFVRRLVLRCEVRKDWRFTDLAREVKRVTFDACSHAAVPPQRIAKLLDRDGDGRQPQVMFGMHGAPIHAPYRDLNLFGAHRTQLMDLQVSTSEFPLSLYVNDTESGPILVLRHQEAILTGVEANLILQQFERVIDEVADRPDATLDSLHTAVLATEREAAASYLTMRARRLGHSLRQNKGVSREIQ